MKTNFSELQEKKDIIIKNVAASATEYVISELFKARGESLVFINQSFDAKRLSKNLAFFLPGVKVLSLESGMELYEFAVLDGLGTAKKIQGLREILRQNSEPNPPAIIIVEHPMFLLKFQPLEYFMDEILIKTGQKKSYQLLVERLSSFGFRRAPAVYEFGEFALRGFIIDIGTPEGFFRVEFDGDEILQIHKFNTDTQRKNGEEIKEICISRIAEVDITEQSKAEFKRQIFSLDLPAEEVVKATAFLNKEASSGLGLGSYIPLFFPGCTGILDFLPTNKYSFVYQDNLPLAFKFFIQNLEKKYQSYKAEGKFILPPGIITYDYQELLAKLKPCIRLSPFGTAEETWSF